ncbi:PE family protein [Mycobacterium intracellulare]|nr:PE family protein [Mycobacterium intracellulare]
MIHLIPEVTAAQPAAHAQMYRAASAPAAAIHETFVDALSTGSGPYAVTETANAAATG